MYNRPLFRDRADAGKRLGLDLEKLHLEGPVVLAIPSGGVPVGVQVAKILSSPLDLAIARKVQYPWTTEAGFGAVAEDGTVYLGPSATALSQEVVGRQIGKAVQEIRRRRRAFLHERRRTSVVGKTVILVDDGLATGSTMLAAIRSIKKKGPKRVVVASPTASGRAIDLLRNEADIVLTLYEHPLALPFAVASSYEEWHDVTDEEVVDDLGTIDSCCPQTRQE